MQRRLFLKSSLALAGATLLPRWAWSTGDGPEAIYDCIVIGAGPAGMTAARELAYSLVQNRPLKILVLEASNRVGGRLFADHSLAADFGSAPELGGEHLHLKPGTTPLWNEIERYSLTTKAFPKFLSGFIYNSRYLAPKPHSPLYSLARLNMNPLKSSRIFKDMNHYQGPDISGEEYLRLQNYTGFVRETAEAMLTGHQGAPLADLSIHGLQSDHVVAQFQNYNDYAIHGGFDRVFYEMKKDLPEDGILFGQRVTEIAPAQNQLLRVAVAGTGHFTARTVLCTASVGFLQSGKIDFTRFWTREKTAALKFIKPSHQIKVSIRFKNRFWDEDMCMLNHLESAKRRAGKTYFVPHYKEANKPPVLSALITGEEARKLSALSQEDLVRQMCLDLTDMYQLNKNVFENIAQRPEGTHVIAVKKWMDDAYARGGVSYLQRHETESGIDVTKARAALASSTNTQPVFWAGEATSLDTQPSSVHGAYATGLRAAKEIHNYLSQRASSR